jgi:hypothetical protein
VSTRPVDVSPPWTIFAESRNHPTRPGKCLFVLPAGRPGEVVDVSRVPDGVVTEVVRSVNAGSMTVKDALGVFEFHMSRSRACSLCASSIPVDSLPAVCGRCIAERGPS